MTETKQGTFYCPLVKVISRLEQAGQGFLVYLLLLRQQGLNFVWLE